ncbi:MAG: hypothetical protein MSJ26_04595 [Oscillospiraceae bacterium]|nr:hypothetical protein [Oscillospiraceae bacterium]
MKRLDLFIALALIMTALTACSGDTSVDRAQKTLESAQNVVGEAIDTKSSQMAEAALDGVEIPDINGGTELPDIDELTE